MKLNRKGKAMSVLSEEPLFEAIIRLIETINWPGVILFFILGGLWAMRKGNSNEN